MSDGDKEASFEQYADRIDPIVADEDFARSAQVVAPSFSVAWSPEDEEYVATVKEFPSLSWLDPDKEEALRGLERLLREEVGYQELADNAEYQAATEARRTGRRNGEDEK